MEGEGGKLVLLIDANKNIRDRKLRRALHSELDMYNTDETVGQAPSMVFYHRGLKQIYGDWETKDLSLLRTWFLSFHMKIKTIPHQFQCWES